jgi:hypothetical protein
VLTACTTAPNASLCTHTHTHRTVLLVPIRERRCPAPDIAVVKRGLGALALVDIVRGIASGDLPAATVNITAGTASPVAAVADNAAAADSGLVAPVVVAAHSAAAASAATAASDSAVSTAACGSTAAAAAASSTAPLMAAVDTASVAAPVPRRSSSRSDSNSDNGSGNSSAAATVQ